VAVNNIAKDSITYILKVLLIFVLGFVAVEIAKLFFAGSAHLQLINKVIFGVCFVGFIYLFGKFIDKYKKK